MTTSTNLSEFKEALKKGIVSFTFTKVDGSTRTAKGTTCNDTIVENGGNLPTGTGYAVSDDVTRYYDINSNGWRSFRNENFVDYVVAC